MFLRFFFAIRFPDGKLDVKHDLIIATSAVAGFSSILFGLCTNLPVGLG